MLNPGNYRLPLPPSHSNEKFTYYGYFIADDKAATENIDIFKDDDNVRIPKDMAAEMYEEEMKHLKENLYMTESNVANQIGVDNIDGELFNVC